MLRCPICFNSDLLARQRALGDDRRGVVLLGQALGHQGPVRAARPQGQRTVLPLRVLFGSLVPCKHLTRIGLN